MRCCFAIAVILTAFGVAVMPRPMVGAAPTSAVQPLDDPLEPLTPKETRTEEDQDRLTAAALFSAGRMLEQRQKFPQALRRYQRALRYDPDALPILREMLPLAFTLERPDEGLRYAVNYLERNPVDPLLLQRTAEFLAESGDWPGALKFYRHVERLIADGKPSPVQASLQHELGRLYFITGEYAKSATAFKQLLEALTNPKKFGLDAVAKKALEGDEGEIYELIGAVFLEAKRPDEARQAFERLQKLKPDDARLALNQAQVELVAGHPQQALDELQKHFDAKKQTKSITAYEVLAGALDDLDQSEELVPRLEALHEAQPDNAPLAFYLGDQYRQAGHWDDAARLLQAAIDGQPTAQAFQSLAEVYRRDDRSEALLELLGQAAEKNGSLSVLQEETEAIVGDDKLLTALIAAAKKQHGEAGEKDAPPLRAAALLASEAKRWDDAETLFDLAIAADSKAASGLLMAWGLDLFLAEKYDRAAAIFQRGIDKKALPDDNPAFYFYLAGALEMQDKSDEALAAAQHAAEKQPKNPLFVSRPAWILYHGKQYDAAYEAYQDFLEKFDDDYSTPGARDSLREARLVLSNLCVLRHDMPQAVEWLEQILDEFPDDAGANNDLGYLWADENQHLRRAYRMIQLAVAEEPDNAAYRDSLGWVLYRLGRNAEALVELQKSLDLQKAADEEPDATVLDHLGDVYAKLGQTAEAREAWKKALAGFKKAKEQEKITAIEKKLANTAP